MNQESLEVLDTFHNVHSEADKSQSIRKSLVNTGLAIFGFTGTIPYILQFLALSKVKTFQREKFIEHSWV